MQNFMAMVQNIIDQLADVRNKLRRKQYYSPQQLRAFRRLRNKLLRKIQNTENIHNPKSLAGDVFSSVPLHFGSQLNLNL